MFAFANKDTETSIKDVRHRSKTQEHVYLCNQRLNDIDRGLAT
jgi:hypothetical protein